MSFHETYSKWKLYSHFPNDINWDINSYKCLNQFDTLETIVSYLEYLPNYLIRNCMLFLMRDNINPIWEDDNNKNGGCFSYKIYNEDVPHLWREMCYYMVSENLTTKDNIHINGISISPKKQFCIIKIWIKENIIEKHINPFHNISGLTNKKIIFKKHIN